MANNYNMRRLSIAVFTALLSVTASQASSIFDHDFVVDGFYFKRDQNYKKNYEVSLRCVMNDNVVVTEGQGGIPNLRDEIVTFYFWSEDGGLDYNYYAKYIGYHGDVVIPGTVIYDDTVYTVTEIDDFAFCQCENLTSVEIPSSVTSIGYGAFYRCKGLTSVEIPNSVTSIGECAFRGCSNLMSVGIGNGVEKIRDLAFRGCSNLTSIDVNNGNEYYSCSDGVLFDKDKRTLIYYLEGKRDGSCTIPETVTVIGDYAFYNYTGLTSVEIPNSVTSIGECAFGECYDLTSVEITNSVTSIGDYAFYSCTGLTSVEIPNSVTSIGNFAFYTCSGLTSVEIGNSVTSIGNFAFAGCSGLTSVEIGNSVTSIGNCAFDGCAGLTSVEIGNSVTSIGNFAFCNCAGLTSVEIGNSVTDIGSYAFEGCTGLTDVYSLNVTPPTCEGSICSSSTYEDATLHVPTSSVEDYKNADIWCEFANIVGLDSYTVTIYISGEEEINVGDEITISALIGGLLEEYATTDTIYAWYMNVDGGEAERIDGSTTDTLVYTPSEAGTYSFYCGVTLNDTTVYSDTTEVEVVAKGSDGSDTGIASIEAEADVTYDVYSIDGIRRMTTRERSEVESLPEGLYIVNGRKIVIRR